MKKAVSILCHLLLAFLTFLAAFMHHKGLADFNDPSGIPYNMVATLLFFIISRNTTKTWYKVLMSVFTFLGIISCILLSFV